MRTICRPSRPDKPELREEEGKITWSVGADGPTLPAMGTEARTTDPRSGADRGESADHDTRDTHAERGDWGEGVEARPIEKEDVAAWAALVKAVEAVDDTGENYDEDDLAEEMTDVALQPVHDTLSLWHDGRMIGYAVAWGRPGAQGLDRVRIEGAVHPQWRRRGLGRRLQEWLCERGRQVHLERNPHVPGALTCGAAATNDGLRAMLGSFGFEPARYFFGMERSLAEPIPLADVPEGLTLVRFTTDLDETLRLAHNEAFLDHWGFQPRDADMWATWMTGSRAFRPETSHLLLDGDQIAAYVLAYEYEADTAATGVRDCYIGQVGTRREWRGRGAARALLTRTMAAAKTEGYDEASLGVDSVNPTGALGLYERLGFRVRREWISFERHLD